MDTSKPSTQNKQLAHLKQPTQIFNKQQSVETGFTEDLVSGQPLEPTNSITVVYSTSHQQSILKTPFLPVCWIKHFCIMDAHMQAQGGGTWMNKARGGPTSQPPWAR